jgi:hypothetical protein
LDEKGRLVAGSLEVLEQVLGITIDELTRFGDSLDTQRQIAETRALLAGQDLADIQGQLERERDILLQALNLDPVFEAMIGSLDLATEEGRDQFREAARRIFEQGLKGFDPTELTGGATAEDILQIINTIANGLNDLGEATRDATDAMLNVPTGFKLAQRRFEAEQPLVLMQPFTGPLAVEALPPQVVTAPSQVNVGDIVIQESKNPRETAKEVVRELKRLSQNIHGTSHRWGEV